MSEELIGLAMWRATDNVLGQMVVVKPMRWDEREGRPIGVCSFDELKHLDDLNFGGWVSEYTSEDSTKNSDWPYYHGSCAEYENVHRIDARRAKVMADFLAKIGRGMEKAQAHEAGDRFMVFASICKAKVVWAAKGPDHKLEAWSRRPEWVQYSLAEGRDSYRRLIAEARAITRDRLLPQKVAA